MTSDYHGSCSFVDAMAGAAALARVFFFAIACGIAISKSFNPIISPTFASNYRATILPTVDTGLDLASGPYGLLFYDDSTLVLTTNPNNPLSATTTGIALVCIICLFSLSFSPVHN